MKSVLSSFCLLVLIIGLLLLAKCDTNEHVQEKPHQNQQQKQNQIEHQDGDNKNNTNSSKNQSSLVDKLHHGDYFPTNAQHFDTSECGKTKGCIFHPKQCVPLVNCTYALGYSTDGNWTYFEMFGALAVGVNAWLAIGFSDDGIMGGDQVTECSSFNGSPFGGRLTYNPGHSNMKVPIDDEKQAQMLRTHFTVYKVGDGLYCQLAQRNQPLEGLPRTFVRPLDDNPAPYIFIAMGETRGKSLQAHSVNHTGPMYPFHSDQPIQLQAFKINAPMTTTAEKTNTTEGPSPGSSEVKAVRMTETENGSSAKSSNNPDHGKKNQKGQ